MTVRYIRNIFVSVYGINVVLMAALTEVKHNQNGNSPTAPKQWREDFVKCNILIQNAIVLLRVLMHLSFFAPQQKGKEI
jgi:hypothetical protein